MEASSRTTIFKKKSSRKGFAGIPDEVGESLSWLEAYEEKQKSLLTQIEANEKNRQTVKMSQYLAQCELDEALTTKMKAILGELNQRPLATIRWRRSAEERNKQCFMEKVHKKLKRRGRWMQKIEGLEESKRAEASALEGDEKLRSWSLIARRQIPKVAKTMSSSIANRITSARRIATICVKEQLKLNLRLQRSEAKEYNNRARKAMKEMLQFWKKNEREERELRKRAEKEAAERRRQEEEERELKRQDKKLHFLLTQTELYSHFIARKTTTATNRDDLAKTQTKTKTIFRPGIDFADLDEEEIKKQAEAFATAAVEAEREKLRKFDAESNRHRRDADGSRAVGLGADVLLSREDATAAAGELDFTHSAELNASSSEAQSAAGGGSFVGVKQPRMLECQLKGYQLKGLTWLANLYEQGINGILADEMGLGKTVQAISLMAHLAETHNIWGPFLVIAPASTLHNWQQELTRFVPQLRALPYWGNVKDRTTLRRFWGTKKLYGRDSPFHVLITSYQLVVSDEKYFQKIKWQYMVLDEAQAIKSSSSVRWKTLLSFSCRNRLLLTGTPIQNSMQELWALLHFIMPGLFDSHDEFSDWFAKDIESHAVAAEAKTGTSTLSPHQLHRLHMILKPFMLRRIKKDVENELGAKVEKDVFCSLTAKQRSLYRAIREKLPLAELMQEKLGNASSSSASDTLMNIVMQFRKVCNHPELFERTDVVSPWVPSMGGMVKGGVNFVVEAEQNPINMAVPKMVLEGREERRGGKFLEFDASIYSMEYVRAMENDQGDPFAAVQFSSFLQRGDVPKLLRSGPLALATLAARNQPPTITRAETEMCQSAADLQKRLPLVYVPKVVAPRNIELIVEDINYTMRQEKGYGGDLFERAVRARLISAAAAGADAASAVPIVLPNMNKLVTDAGKMLALDRLLKELKEGGHRVLIYNQMTRMIDIMEEYLTCRGYKYIRLDGSSKISDRRDLVSDWQSRPDIFIFLLSTRAGGLGINLTAADTVIFYDSDWNPTVDQQAMDRAHRLGQTKQVTVYRLITRGSIEERMRQRAKQKDEIHQVVIAGGEFRQFEGTAAAATAASGQLNTMATNNVSRPNQKDIVSLLLEEETVNESNPPSEADPPLQPSEPKRARLK